LNIAPPPIPLTQLLQHVTCNPPRFGLIDGRNAMLFTQQHALLTLAILGLVYTKMYTHLDIDPSTPLPMDFDHYDYLYVEFDATTRLAHDSTSKSRDLDLLSNYIQTWAQQPSLNQTLAEATQVLGPVGTIDGLYLIQVRRSSDTVADPDNVQSTTAIVKNALQQLQGVSKVELVRPPYRRHRHTLPVE
jgi:hypothetical protein